MNKNEFGKGILTKKRFIKSVPVFVVLLVVLTGIVYKMGARDFWQGFGYTFLLWVILRRCVMQVFIWIWYLRMKRVQKKEAANLTEKKVFLANGIPLSVGVGIVIAMIVGGMLQLCR